LPGVFRPAGAVFPFDAEGARGGRITLSWRGGVDALFYRELASAAAALALAAPETPDSPVNPERAPQNFDWPRFRELFEGTDLPEDVRNDPWAADWNVIAQATVQKGFDRRRITGETKTDVRIPVPGILWIGVSPFAQPVKPDTGEAPVFPVGASGSTWVSSAGILRCTVRDWILIPWPVSSK
jgi:hypothetical protein